MQTFETKVPPPLLAVISALAIIGIWYFYPTLQIEAPRIPSKIMGLVIIAVGLIVPLIATHQFRRSNTTILPFNPENTSNIVTSGIFGLTRNPMYLGMMLTILGTVFLTRQPIGLLFVFFFVAFITRFQIMPEERILESKFGEEYRAYKSRVRRWF